MTATGPERAPRYRYKVLSSQMPRTFVEVEAASIEEAEAHGIVIILLGPVGTVSL